MASEPERSDSVIELPRDTEEKENSQENLMSLSYRVYKLINQQLTVKE